MIYKAPINIPVVKGDTHASFTLIPITNAGKIVNFSITGLPPDVQLGSVAKLSDGNNMILYINGTQVATVPMSGKIDHYGYDIYLGKVNNVSAYTPGTFGDMRIYNRALSASEISILYLK